MPCAHTHTTTRGGVERSWLVSRLWELAEGLPVREMDPKELPEFDHLMDQAAGNIWWSRDRGIRGDFRMWDMARHTRLVMEADLSFPILLNPEGGVMDGCHRIMKAYITGQHVLVQKFTDWPPEE